MKYFVQLVGSEKLLLLLLAIVIVVTIFTLVMYSRNIECTKNIYNCSDFNSRDEVQRVFEKCENDIHNLDRDNDGIPCESI